MCSFQSRRRKLSKIFFKEESRTVRNDKKATRMSLTNKCIPGNQQVGPISSTSNKMMSEEPKSERSTQTKMQRRGGIGTRSVTDERPFIQSLNERNVLRRGAIIMDKVPMRQRRTIETEIDDVAFTPQDEVTSPSHMHIIIDANSGFDSDHDGNKTFYEILRAYYATKYSEAIDKTHRRILLHTILDDMYNRGFNFVWKNRQEKCFALKDDLIILQNIRSALKQIVI
jgi:hypothetical protein